MSAVQLETAKREAEAARRRLETTLGALQQRLHPKALANEAWDGVREKSNDLAENTMHAVKQRPGTVSMALAAFTIFLARKPIRRTVTRLFAGEEEDDGRVTTTIE